MRHGIDGADQELVAAKATKLRMANQHNGLTAVRMPLGLAQYVSNAPWVAHSDT